ncbi:MULTISPECIES: YadA-like family protein [unclassified Acinetobacter]|uniref:YadA-like family protein n=1 Tax=unclassified Acinetobacter TaxID=196816 RepID=UPI00190A1699|nr:MULTISPECIES: YadA-like family protein [unclassified Acinetobacter]MBK0063660.1 YadA-like family protein [Acinetobacter sp. S55]MBK0067538.1 YadA-like family protein [Acinetobacter sp. S54]
MAGTAIGSNSQANSNNAVSIGSNAGQGTANLPGNANQNHIAIGTSSGQNITGNENIAIGLQASNNTTGSYNIAIGSKAGQGAAGEESVSIGYISNQSSTAINHTTALGARTQSGQGAVAVGYSANASNQGAVAVGALSKVQGVDDGTGNITNADNGVALGTNAWSQDNSIALGTNSIASSTTSQTQAGYITSALIGDEGVVSVGADSNGATASFNRRIVHVADGAGDYDAVNVNQLRKAQEKVADIIGGNVTVNSQTGDYSQITLKDTSGKEYQYNTVVEALGALSTGAIQLPATENAVTYTDATSKQINLRPNTVISGVAEGKVGTDAVNVEQMQQAVEESRAKYISVNSTTKGNRANEGATGINAVAIGPDAIAANNNSTAIGSKVQSLGDYATVIGTADSVVYDTAGVAIGNHAISRGEGSIVIGKDAKAAPQTSPTGKIDNAIAIGTQALVTNEKGIAIGQNTIAEGAESIAQGYDSRSTGNASTALGVSSRASAENAYALGTNANSSATNALAFGNAAKSAATDSIATGTNATTYATNAVALGKGAVSGKANPTKEEIDNNSNSDTIAIGTNSFAQIKNALAVGNTAKATEESSLALGTESQATAKDAISVGQKSQASGLNSLALGKEAQASQESAIAQGYGAKALNINTIAQGVNAQASADYAIATGTNALATGSNAIAQGQNAKALNTNSIAQGLNAQATAANAVAIGANTIVTNENAVALGNGSASGSYNQTTKGTINGKDYNYAGSGAGLSTVSVGSVNNERQIINVAAGRVTSSSTDAINGSQLYQTNQAIQDLADTPLAFAGDSGTQVNRKLGQQLKVTGGATGTLTDGNIGVVANGSDTLQLKLAKDVNLTNAGSVTVGTSSVKNNEVKVGANTLTDTGLTVGTTSVTTGNVSGLSNTTWDPAQTYTGGRAATQEQLKSVSDVAQTANKGWNLTTNKDTANKTNVAPDSTVDFSNSDSNITVSHTGTNVDVKLANAIKVGPTTGGSPVTINGNTGEITGLSNKTTTNADFATVGRAATEEQLKSIQTGLTDAGFGLKAGDGNSVTKKLGETVDIVGADSNITTKVVNGQVAVELAKDVNLSKAGSLTVGNSKVTDGKVELTDGTKSNSSTVDGTTVTDGTNSSAIGAGSISVSNGTNQTSIGATQIVVGGASPVTLNGATGRVSGLTNTTWDANGTYNQQQAATEEQLKAVSDVAQTANKGWNLTTNKDTANKTNVAPDATVDFSNSDSNITVSHTGTNVDVKLAEVVNIGGQPGGSTVTVNGKDGTITGLTNKVFDPNNYTIGRAATEDQLATPLTFTGDNAGVNVQRKLGQQLSIVGGESVETNLTDNNIGVVADSTDNKLTVKLAKDIKVESVNAAGTVIDSKGLSFVNSSGGAVPNSPSISATGINAGTNKITNVGAGAITDTSMDAVNGSQIKGIIDQGFTVSSNGNTASKDTIALGENVDFSATDTNIKVTNTGNNQITFGLEPVIKVGPTIGGSPITINGNTGEITGLSNKTTSNADFATVGRAATEEQLKSIQTGLTDAGFGLKAGDGNSVTKKLGETVDIVGADSNITTKVVNGQVAVELAKDVNLSKAGSLTVGNSKVTDGKVELTDGTKSNSSTVDGTTVTDGTNSSAIGAGSISVSNGTNQTSIGATQIVVGGASPVTLNGATGRVSGLTNTTWDANGTYNQQQAATEEQLKAVSDVAQTANKGWNIKSDSTLASTQVKPEDTVDIGLAAGETNLKAAATNANGTTTIDFSLSKDLLLDSVNAGGTIINNSGLSFVDPITGLPLSNSPSISFAGINAGNQKITNVQDGEVSSTSKDAVNGSQLQAVSDVANKGWKLTTDQTGTGTVTGSSVSKVAPDDTVTFVAGNNIAVQQSGNQITVATTPEVSFDKVTVGNVVIDKTTNKITGVEAGTVAQDSKDAINGGQLYNIATKIRNIIGGNTTYDPGTGTYVNNNIGDTGKDNINDAIKSINETAQNANKGWTVSTNGQNASQVKPTDTVDFANKDGNISINNTGNNITVDLAKDITVESVTAGDTTVNDNGLTIDGGPSVTKNGIDAAGNKVTGVAEGSIAQNSKDAVNGSQIHDIIGDGAFQGGDGNTITNIGGTGATNINDAISSINKTAGQHTTVEAGQNITVKESTNSNGGKEYTVATADDVKFNSVTSNTVTANTVKVGDVNIDQNGINAGNHKITNVAPGEISSTSKDAVNGSQLNTSNQYVVDSLGGGAKYENGQFTAPTYNVNNGSYNNVGDALGALNQADVDLGNRITNLGDRLEQVFYNVNSRIDDVEKKANAGIASAMALEGAPFVAGKFTYAVGAAYHGGENAVGATLRKTADNGRWSITGGVAAASQGDPSVRVGISGVID